jgi:uncharacterized protein involved in exopolysaccharide biosynthesis
MSTDPRDPGLTDVIGFYWQRRLLVGAGGLACALIAGVWVFTLKPVFRAEVVVTMAPENGMERNSLLGSEIGGLASLAGVNLTQANAQSIEAAAILESNYLAEEFVSRDGLLPVLLARSSKAAPTVWRAAKLFRESVLNIRKDQRRGITTVSVEWTDPALAARWANAYVALADELIRARTLADSTRNIAYLNDQLAKTTDVELRKVIYTLIEGQTKTLMLANGRAQYAFDVVDPAVAPELKVGPHRLQATLIALILGIGITGGVVFLWESIGRRKRRSTAGPGVPI